MNINQELIRLSKIHNKLNNNNYEYSNQLLNVIYSTYDIEELELLSEYIELVANDSNEYDMFVMSTKGVIDYDMLVELNTSLYYEYEKRMFE